MNLTNFLCKGISYDAESQRLSKEGLSVIMMVGGSELPPVLEAKLFSLASDSAKLLSNILKAKSNPHQYYLAVEEMKVLDLDMNQLTVGLVQELSTLPTSDVKEFNLQSIIMLVLNLLDKMTNQEYLVNFKKMVNLGKLRSLETNRKG